MNQPRSFDFDKQLKASDGHCESADVTTILLENIAGSLNVTRAHPENDKSGVDWWVECLGGRHLAVDAKVRTEDWRPKGFDDLALEIWSVVEQKKIGWTLDEKKRCDYILWLWTDTGRWCMVPFPMLCAVFKSNLTAWQANPKYKSAKQKTEKNYGPDYHSECIFVPRHEIWAAIYRRFGCGQLIKTQTA